MAFNENMKKQKISRVMNSNCPLEDGSCPSLRIGPVLKSPIDEAERRRSAYFGYVCAQR